MFVDFALTHHYDAEDDDAEDVDDVNVDDDDDDDELTHQPNVLVDPHIPRFEALGTGVSPTVDRVIVRRQEIACSKGG